LTRNAVLPGHDWDWGGRSGAPPTAVEVAGHPFRVDVQLDSTHDALAEQRAGDVADGRVLGGVNQPVVMVELKLPDIGLAEQSSRASFIAEATDIVREFTTLDHDDRDIWVNILNARDGAWGIAGQALTNEELIAGITTARPA
jgi:phenylpyruvate tautomerase PptA (4-oxalocrotonate tautomerase family)